MTKEGYVNTLIKDPAYDADWIDKVSDLLSTYSIEQLEEVGISDLNMLDKLDVRVIHVINTLMVSYIFKAENSKDKHNNDLISTMIAYLVKQKYHINATQAQLIGAVIDFKVKEETPDYNFDSDILGELIEADIPYSSLNFIAKAIIEGHNEIMEYRNSAPDTIAAIYALLADGVYDAVSKRLHFSDFNDNNELIIDNKNINLFRYLELNKYEYYIDDNGDVVITA